MKSQSGGKEKPKSRAYYRVEATRSATGGKIITSEVRTGHPPPHRSRPHAAATPSGSSSSKK